MKNILLKSLAVLSVSLSAAGCIEETFPQGSTQTQSQVSASTSALQAMVNSLPAAMTSQNTTGYFNTYGFHGDFGLPAIHIMTEMMLEDIATQNENPYVNRYYFYTENVGMDSRSWPSAYFWDAYYPWIKGCNDVIRSIDPKSATAEISGYLGQAYAYRALCYMDLARLYEPKENGLTDVSKVLGLTVPIVDESTTEEMAKNNPRAPKEKMYQFILSDLKNAEKYLAGQNYSYTRPTLMAAYGMMARLYIELGYWKDTELASLELTPETAFANAAQYARKVIDESGKRPLNQKEWSDPVTGFNSGAANGSWIWGLTVSNQNVGNLGAFTAHMSTEALYGYAPMSRVGASKRFYERISYSDFRKYTWLDPDWTGFKGGFSYDYQFAGDAADLEVFLNGDGDMIPGATAYQSLKFRPAQGECTDYTTANTADHPIMRIEEMYFIEIEANAHTDLGKAQTLLTTFLNTYRYTDGSYSVPGTASGLEGFLEEMLFQKRVEFWGEGILLYDYKRLDIGITRGYEGSNHIPIWQFNTERRSPQWNIVITRGEFQSNEGITDATNNPDPSQKLELWTNK